MADLTVDVLTFQNSAVIDPNNWPKLSCTSANQLSLEVSSLRLDSGRELFFRDVGQIRCLDDNHRLVFNRLALRLEIHEQGDISFLTGGPPTERMVILAGGNVGIGVAVPFAPLEVAGFIRSSDGLESNAAKKMQVGTRQAQPLELLTNNTAALTIDAAGKIGIGLANPGTKLAVATPTDSYGISHTDGVAQLSTFVGAGTTGVTNGGWIGTVSNHDLRFFTANGPSRMAITTSGNVGIGTLTPFTKLTLTGSLGFTNAATPMMFIFESGTNNPERGIAVHSPAFQNWGLFYNDSADQMIFRFAGNPTLTVGNGMVGITGNVGIGTTAPAQKLHVKGNYIRVDGAANEQCYIGGDGFGNDIQLGSFNPAVTNVGLWNATTNTRMDLFARNITFTGNLVGGGKGGYVMDQFINKLGEALEEGDVVVVGLNQSSLVYGLRDNIPIPEVDLAENAYDTRVCGVVCEVSGELRSESEVERGTKAKDDDKSEKTALRPQAFTPEEVGKLGHSRVQPGQLGWMVTLGAFAHCKVDADIAPIEVGDLLTTSPTRGHAQKAIDPAKAVGAIVGKALAPFSRGKGKIPVLVLLQ